MIVKKSETCQGLAFLLIAYVVQRACRVSFRGYHVQSERTNNALRPQPLSFGGDFFHTINSFGPVV